MSTAPQGILQGRLLHVTFGRDGIKFRGSSSEEWREGVALVSDEDIASGVKTWENALVGYVWGPIPSTEYDMPIDRLFLDKLILKFVDLECRNYGNVKFYSKGLGVYLFDFESFEAKQLVSDKGGVLNNSYRWGTPTATCPKQFSWSEAFHIPISKVFEKACYGEFSSLREVMVEFAAAMSKPARLNRYPACPISSEIPGLVPHTDSDYLTILSQDEVGGLQLMKDSKWVAVKPNPDAFIVNIGDLSRNTNQLLSTVTSIDGVLPSPDQHTQSSTGFIPSIDGLGPRQLPAETTPASNPSSNILQQHHSQTDQQIQLPSASDSSRFQIDPISNSALPDTLDALPVTRRVSIRPRQPPSRMQDYVTYNVRYPVSKFMSYHRLSPTHSAFLTSISNVHEPKSFKEAQSQPLPNLKLHLWSVQVLSKIAGVMGTPLFTDKITASRERVEYARICVEIPFDRALEIPNSVTIEDEKACSYIQEVQY
ncbi:hypothetical protein POTOM_028914 [Populus tomentosa]|uniref:Fe2OG dioxygenase domain-containing protein n=1 Tax=Populus tomentosa TaxID=118781 RepID=A0A8X7ZF94_POPTO|nr:hypothetical protein POTOM_028914 [Populus tomentosa]